MKNFSVPKFISFEGGDGSGKSTQSKMFYNYLLANNIEAILTREIGGAPAAEAIRDIVIHQAIAPTAELLLVMAARYEHIQKLILPALAKGQWVVSDRYVDSTACYQGGAAEIGLEKVYKLHQELGLELLPDLTFFVDLPPFIAINRAKARGGNNKFEEMGDLYHQNVYHNFKIIAQKFKDRIISVDALDLDEQQLHQNIIKHFIDA